MCFQRTTLVLTGEEKRLLEAEGVVLPTDMSLTKVREDLSLIIEATKAE